MEDFKALEIAMGNLEEGTVYSIITQVMSDGGRQAPAAMEACQHGMSIVGSRFNEGEYFVGDLIYAGDLISKAIEMIKPALVGKISGGASEKMILCTVKNDLHDIGKNIVKAMLEAAGFVVLDLGIDVPPEIIVETAREQKVRIIGLSAVLTLAVDSMRETVEALAAAGLREDVKVIIGGAPVNEAVCKSTGADAWASSPQDTVDICRNWSKELKPA